MRRLILVWLIVTLLGMVVAAVAANRSSAIYGLTPNVLPSGGQSASSADYALEATVGQTFIGKSSSADYALCNGFWCQIAATYRVFLAIVLRSSQ